jgi:hypothetical protein
MKWMVFMFLLLVPMLVLAADKEKQDDSEELKKKVELLENQLYELKADLELQKALEGTKEEKFKVYGYFGTRFNSINVEDETSPFNNVFGRNPYFVQSNLNLYFLFRPTTKFKVLAELRFYYGSEGKTLKTASDTSLVPPGTVVINSYTTLNNDPYFFDLGNAFNYKSHLVRIERAWMEYNVKSFLNFRLGHFVTPFGIWNVDHGLPVIISPRIPFSMSYLPVSQTGFQVYGTFYLPHTDLFYSAYVSNGYQDQNYEIFDQNNDKAIGGRLRLSLQSPLFKKLAIGASAYHGLKTVKQTGNAVYVNPITQELIKLEAIDRNVEEYMENVFGLDFLLEYAGFSLQSEFFKKQISYFEFHPEYLDPAIRALPGISSPLPDDNTSYYVQGYYSLKLGKSTVSPYVRYEELNGFIPSNPYQPTPFTRFKQTLKIYTFGINLRQNAFVTYKLDYTRTEFDYLFFDFDAITLSATIAF